MSVLEGRPDDALDRIQAVSASATLEIYQVYD